MYGRPPYCLIDAKAERPEWLSYHRLLLDLIAGVVRRNTFTAWEVELLLDLEDSRLRKAGREGTLRRYLRAVHQSQLEGAEKPPRLTAFLSSEHKAQGAVSGGR